MKIVLMIWDQGTQSIHSFTQLETANVGCHTSESMALPWPRFLKESMIALNGVPLSLYLTFSILWDVYLYLIMVAQLVKNTPANTGDAGDSGSILGFGRAPGNGSSNPLQYSCLGNSMDRRDWLTMVHGVTKSQTQLSCMHTHTRAHTHTHTPDHECSFVF